jgi:DnaK suppressor protein
MLSTALDAANGSVAERRADIRRMLVERRRELLNEIQSRIRDVREEGTSTDHHAAHLGEPLEPEPEEDLAFALIQMKAEMLERVNEAVRTFDEGAYGSCVDCGEVIGQSRLEAMPFAVRCRECQESRENEQHRDRIQLRRGLSGLGARMDA